MIENRPCQLVTAVLVSLFVTAVPLSEVTASDFESQWVAMPITVDGDADDWENIPTTYLEDEGVVLGMCNDSTNVYVLFRIRDARSAMSIRRAGLTIWLNSEGKEKKKFGVRYNGGPSLSEIRELMTDEEEEMFSEIPPERMDRMGRRFSGIEDRFTVFYDGEDKSDSIPTDGSRGPAVSYASSNGLYTYEFSIPLQNSDYGIYGMGALFDEDICIGPEWGGRPDDRGPGGGMGRGGGPGGGMGGGSGGRGGRGGGRGGGPPGGSRMGPSEEHEFWVTTKLALPDGE